VRFSELFMAYDSNRNGQLERSELALLVGAAMLRTALGLDDIHWWMCCGVAPASLGRHAAACQFYDGQWT
jgi:hypothetical protein